MGTRRRFGRFEQNAYPDALVVELAEAEMLPAIYFVFSRAGCDRSVQYLMEAGIRLTTPDEEERILERADARTACFVLRA